MTPEPERFDTDVRLIGDWQKWRVKCDRCKERPARYVVCEAIVMGVSQMRLKRFCVCAECLRTRAKSS